MMFRMHLKIALNKQFKITQNERNYLGGSKYFPYGT